MVRKLLRHGDPDRLFFRQPERQMWLVVSQNPRLTLLTVHPRPGWAVHEGVLR